MELKKNGRSIQKTDYTKVKIMENTFDFREALDCIKSGMVVGITINGKERQYYLNQFGEVVCTPNGKEHLTYKVKQFQIDAVMSNEWKLYE